MNENIWDIEVHMQVGGGPADGENVFHRNITNPLPDNMASH
jgi:hypothetical protein